MGLKFKKDFKGIKERKERMTGLSQMEDDEMEEQLSQKRIQALEKEFELLNFCINASLILFKDI